jgi:Domain of unknown function (DUF4160)
MHCFPHGGIAAAAFISPTTAQRVRAATWSCAAARIDTLEPIEATLGRRQLRLVLAWAELHQDELLENWQLARAGETLHEIDPLR